MGGEIWKAPRSELDKSLEVSVWMIDLEPMVTSQGSLVWCACASTERRGVPVSVVICKPAQPERRKRNELADSDVVFLWVLFGAAFSRLVCVVTLVPRMCMHARARVLVHVHASASWICAWPELGRTPTANHQGRRNSWVLKFPGLSFPGAHTAIPQTGS